MTDDVTMQRVEEGIAWYDRRAFYNQVAYELLKIIVIATAALIPFLSNMPGVALGWRQRVDPEQLRHRRPSWTP
jgi:hypothetical protein